MKCDFCQREFFCGKFGESKSEEKSGVDLGTSCQVIFPDFMGLCEHGPYHMDHTL